MYPIKYSPTPDPLRLSNASLPLLLPPTPKGGFYTKDMKNWSCWGLLPNPLHKQVDDPIGDCPPGCRLSDGLR